MKYVLRDYQQASVDAVLAHFRKSQQAAVVVLPTGAGKSLVIAELSRLAKGRVLCLAHVKELVEQNHQKFLATGHTAGIFSAGLNEKSSHFKTTFASIQSISNHLDAFEHPASLIIIDECHRVNQDDEGQYQQTIEHFKTLNPNVRVLGLTATPYRLGSGWIYQHHYHGFTRISDDQKENVFFSRCVYELPLQHMVKQGYLTKPIHYNAATAHYDFSQLDESLDGDQDVSDLELNELIQRHPRVTQAVTEQILQFSHDRQGVMIFAATIDHAEEIFSYLPESETAIVTGKTPRHERDRIINKFKSKQLKYLVNVSVLTTGFDAPHVDVIAILRPTQSISLFQQIVGRGLRLSPGKKDCLILDYTNKGYDIFQPEIGEKKPNNASQAVQVHCPKCGFANTFWGELDDQGNLLEHYGRRCHGLVEEEPEAVQCDYRFSFKTCPYCQAENDIAARQCQSCFEKLIDPDEQLRQALNLKGNRVLRCSGLTIEIEKSKNRLKAIYHDEDGLTLSEYFHFNQAHSKALFNQLFTRRLAGASVTVDFEQAEEVNSFIPYLPCPDFVISKKNKHFWQVTERLFDYQGAYRKANQLN
ncbi:DEAD/DEAH box helicase family protein [Marinomonas epiphytica]